MDSLLDLLRTQETPSLRYRVATRHGYVRDRGRWKLSFRPYVSGMSIRYADIPRVIRYAGQESYWDMSPYKAGEQLLAAIGGHKSASDLRVLAPESADDDVMDYVAQFHDASWPLLDLPSDWCGVHSTPPSPPTADVSFLSGLVALLSPNHADARDTWIRVGLALKSSGAPYSVFETFSQRSSKYSSADCAGTWASFRARASGSVGVGTLCMWARESDAAGYAALQASRRRSALQPPPRPPTPPAASDRGCALAALGRLVQPLLCPGQSADSLRVTSADVEGVEFEVDMDPAPLRGRLIRKSGLAVVRSPAVSHMPLASRLEFNGSLGYLHKNIESSIMTYACTPQTAHVTHLTAPSTVVKLYEPPEGDAFADIQVDGRAHARVKAKTVMQQLRTALQAQLAPQVERALGAASSLFMINNGTITVNLDPEAGKTDDETLARALMESSPELARRLVFAPDLRSGNCNGIHYCDPATNVWVQRSNAELEKLMVDAFGGLSLSPSDRKHVNSRRGRNDLLYVFASRSIDNRLRQKLDSDLDVFAVDNGLFDVRSKSFRGIEPGDYVSTTAGWSYSSEAAREHRGEVESCLGRVLPVREEREVVLTFFASLLSGRREEKKFLVLTDRQSGNNGKSTLASLMLKFFGRLASGNTSFVCRGSFDRDRESHSAGTEAMAGKRLLIAEELKHGMTLDDALLKRYAGGAGVAVEGRRCGSGEHFKYVWQAGIVLVFNEGDCPKFDASDSALAERMLVAPMRSKFVDRAVGDEDGEWAYRMDKSLHRRFDAWLSAVADALLERFDGDGLSPCRIPPSMLEWRRGIEAGANPLSHWLDGRYEVTGVRTDYLLVSDLKAAYRAEGCRGVEAKDFARLALAYFGGVAGADPKARGHLPCQAGAKRESERNFVLGVRVREVQ